MNEIESIIEYCRNNSQQINMQFGNELEDKEIAWMFDPANWLQRDSELIIEDYDLHDLMDYLHDSDYMSDLDDETRQTNIYNFVMDNMISRTCWNCEPFDDQLRAYVFSTDDQVILVHVQAE